MIIGLTGYARSGKNTAAEFMQGMAPFTQMAFADALREMALGIDPIIEQASGFFHGLTGTIRYSQIVEAIDYEEAKKHPEVRRFLQRLGTEGVRKVFGPDAWVEALKHRALHEMHEEGKHVVITDVRFKNEAAFVQQHGQLWRIERPGTGPANDHPSEREQESFEPDLIITANDRMELGMCVAKAVATTLKINVIYPIQPLTPVPLTRR